MSGRASIPIALMVSAAASLLAQPAAEPRQLDLGKAAMDAHDPTTAITHFQQDDSKSASAWLAVALMMESRSPSDQYVERAFDAAARARAAQAHSIRPRRELAAALRPGDLVVTFLVAEKHAYAWAFDRHALIGYPLPPPDDIAIAVERIKAYLANNDRAGVKRIAGDLMPALLGPVAERIPSLTRAIFVMDGPLRQLAIGELPIAESESRLSQQLAVATVDDGSLLDEVQREPSAPTLSARPMVTAGAIVVGIVMVVGALALWRRSSVA